MEQEVKSVTFEDYRGYRSSLSSSSSLMQWRDGETGCMHTEDPWTETVFGHLLEKQIKGSQRLENYRNPVTVLSDVSY